MSEIAGSNQAPPFRAVLVPHRSLGPAGFMLVMGGFGAVSLITGLVFLRMGAWPVTAFFGLDVLLLYLAFQLNYRSGRQCEIVEMSPQALTLTRVHPSGRREQFAFDPLWTRVRLVEWTDGRTDLQLALRDRGFSFGRFLNDDERRDLATALRDALLDARGGTRI